MPYNLNMGKEVKVKMVTGKKTHCVGADAWHIRSMFDPSTIWSSKRHKK